MGESEISFFTYVSGHDGRLANVIIVIIIIVVVASLLCGAADRKVIECDCL